MLSIDTVTFKSYTLSPAFNEQNDAKKLLVVSRCLLQPNLLTLQVMILMQRNLFDLGVGARCNRTPCMRDPVYLLPVHSKIT